MYEYECEYECECKESEAILRIKNIVFSAGSMGGLTYIGAWKALEEKGLTTGIINYSGCSIGAIIAMLTSIGYCSNELHQLALGLRYYDISEFQVLRTFENLGLETGNEIERLLRELLFFKTGYHDITFKMHHTITGRDLWVNASCVENDTAYYFSRSRSPDMSIIKAVRMSISLPVIMVPVKYNGLTFIDGGFHDPCPAGMFDRANTLILRVKNTYQTSDTVDAAFIQYLGMIIRSIYRRLNNRNLEEYNIVWIESCIGSLTLDVNRSTKQKLIRIGYKTLMSHLLKTFV